ncbi:MAG: M55 family metallopeptidase [Actinobacteria bacterium]|nr:M55 family metallopeptidase [Actinomycetota bacterium]MCA1720959.1 M55 family metallopeptidase [Actinomycetota bacterium]
MGIRVFISVDMEGVAGVATLDQIIRGGTGYPRAQELMTAETNAAIRGAFAGGADEVVVNDSHGTMDNLLHEKLDPRARLVFGAPRPSCMVQGVTREDTLAVFVGYHAAAGAHGVLSHTFSSNFTELRVNGQPMSEAEVNGLFAGSLGVPVGVLTGDDQICQLAEKAFPGIVTVPVKQAEGTTATSTLHPHVACDLIERAVAGAVGAGTVAPTPVPEQLSLEIDFATPLMADLAATVVGSRRLSARTLQRDLDSVADLLSLVMSWYYLSSIAAQQSAALAFRR